MFKVTVAMEEVGSFDNFAEAFKAFFNGVKKILAEGTTYQVLETTCWIEYEETAMYFYDARDLAYKVGVLQGKGQLVDPLPQVDPDVISQAFLNVAGDLLDGLESELMNALVERKSFFLTNCKTSNS